MKTFILHYSGELSVKAKGTRNRFSERLARNLADALESEGVEAEVRRTWSRIYLESADDGVAELVSRVFGVQAVTLAQRRPWRSLDDLLAMGEELFASEVAGRTFAVRVQRGGRKQGQDFKSPDVERQLGARLAPHAAGVDLKNPQVEVRIELRRTDAYFSCRREPASGGLPIGAQGRALALLSGGFDSAVAAWQMLRRGVRLDYLFCNLGGDAHRDSVLEVAKLLSDRWSYGYRPQLHMMDFRPVVDELRSCCPQPLWQVLLKRQMLRAADVMARITRSSAIVTGEAVGQVSSQTLQNLAVISTATEVPLLRPLIGANKEEILEVARRIGTHDASARVVEHCALTPRQPETHAKPRRVEKVERALDPDKLEVVIGQRAGFDLRALDLRKTSAADLEVDHIPEGAAVIDLRSPVAYRSWHYPDALLLGYREALEAAGSLRRDKTYVLYCEIGLKSAHVAEVLREAGYRAHHFGGGLKPLLRYFENQDSALRAALSPVLLSD